MVTAETTEETFKELNQSGEREKRQLQVYNIIKGLGACSNSMIAHKLKLPINCITGRVNELRNKLKLVGFSHKDTDPYTKRKVIYWKVVRDWHKEYKKV